MCYSTYLCVVQATVAQLNQNLRTRAREMAPRVKSLAAKPDKLSSVPGTHPVGRRELTPAGCPLASILMPQHPHTQKKENIRQKQVSD